MAFLRESATGRKIPLPGDTTVQVEPGLRRPRHRRAGVAQACSDRPRGRLVFRRGSRQRQRHASQRPTHSRKRPGLPTTRSRHRVPGLAITFEDRIGARFPQAFMESRSDLANGLSSPVSTTSEPASASKFQRLVACGWRSRGIWAARASNAGSRVAEDSRPVHRLSAGGVRPISHLLDPALRPRLRPRALQHATGTRARSCC